MIIGTDFDNTIVCYDKLFYDIALKKKLIPKNLAPVKEEIRNYLRKAGKESSWTELQGYVYGPGTLGAKQFEGALEFFIKCKKAGNKAFVISHKTLHPYLGSKFKLHMYAHKWLQQNGFYDAKKTGLSKKNVFFELTKEEKIKRIVRQKCTHYIDDLPEFLSEKSFPSNVKRVLFDPNKKHNGKADFECIASWQEMIEKIK